MIFGLLISCKNEPNKNESTAEEAKKDSLEPVSDEMMESAVIYEANIRQYSPEGSFDAFTKDIPQLKELGVKVIWLMPMYPISEKNRKATGGKDVEDIEDPKERKKYLGSYYSISDYSAVNPEHGNMEDFDELVETAHENGMYVILDWLLTIRVGIMHGSLNILNIIPKGKMERSQILSTTKPGSHGAGQMWLI